MHFLPYFHAQLHHTSQCIYQSPLTAACLYRHLAFRFKCILWSSTSWWKGTKKYKLNYVWWLNTPDIPCFRVEGVWQYYSCEEWRYLRAFIFYNIDPICKNCTTLNFLHWPQSMMLEKHNICVVDQGVEKRTMPGYHFTQRFCNSPQEDFWVHSVFLYYQYLLKIVLLGLGSNISSLQLSAVQNHAPYMLLLDSS